MKARCSGRSPPRTGIGWARYCRASTATSQPSARTRPRRTTWIEGLGTALRSPVRCTPDRATGDGACPSAKIPADRIRRFSMHRRALIAALIGAALISSSAATPAAAQSRDPSFRVVNRTSDAVQEVYASPSTQQNWGQDRLGSDIIQPGASHIVRLPADGNCVYDIRFVYQNGRSEEKRNLNTCNLTNVVLS